ncbi:MAG: 2'-5' RNA ligase family protein [Anaerolineales bacterium]
MPSGIVSLLDEQHDALTRNLWAELEQRFDLHSIGATPYPHFSYHVARGYDAAGVERVLETIAAHARPFEVSTTGLGVFTGSTPVLYLPVVRTQALTEFHEQVWSALEPFATNSMSYYAPQNWMPHITLAQHDLTPEVLAAVMGALGTYSFNWVLMVNNLAFIEDTGNEQSLKLHCEFGDDSV